MGNGAMIIANREVTMHGVLATPFLTIAVVKPCSIVSNRDVTNFIVWAVRKNMNLGNSNLPRHTLKCVCKTKSASRNSFKRRRKRRRGKRRPRKKRRREAEKSRIERK